MKAVVIGAGVAGLASAIRLATLGMEVAVYEANSYPGGKLTAFEKDGFRFDAGPSLFTLPEQVEELFTLAGKPISAYFSYQKLPVITEYFYENGLRVKAWADPIAFAVELQKKTGESSDIILAFLRASQQLYELTENVFLTKSLHQVATYLHPDTFKAVLKINRLKAFDTMHQANEKWFKTPEVIQLFNRYATYNGSDPYQCPATMNIIPHLEFGIGAFFPKGGMHSITMALYQLAQDLGVSFHFGQKVEQIEVAEKKVNGIRIGSERILADVVVSNMDIVGTYKKLLPQTKAPARLLKQPKSSSALIFYWGIKKTFPQLDLHNIFFSQHYQQEFATIFKEKSVFEDPTVYVNITSKLEPTDAPEGMENWFTMINVPNNSGQNWDELIPFCRKAIIEKMRRILKEPDFESLIVTEEILDPRLIEARTSSTQGALYGNSSNNRYAAFLRHPNFSQKIKNLYFCGGSVHPGGGIPLCLLSARIVYDLVRKRTLGVSRKV